MRDSEFGVAELMMALNFRKQCGLRLGLRVHGPLALKAEKFLWWDFF
jgi:hypothetical protein